MASAAAASLSPEAEMGFEDAMDTWAVAPGLAPSAASGLGEDVEVANHAGGIVFALDDMARLRRFLILGSDGANYYVDSNKLALENALCVSKLLSAGKGLAVVGEVVRISRAGRAPKQGPGIFVLAMAARLGDKEARAAALAALPLVCRTASTLFEFIERVKDMGKAAEGAEAGAAGKISWGRAMRRAVAAWYLEKSPSAVAYQITKYSQRGGWSHADLLRLAHPDPAAYLAKKSGPTTVTPTGAEKVAAVVEEGQAADAEAAAEVEAGGAAGEQEQQQEQRVADFKALFSFIVSGGKVVPEKAAATANAQRKRKAEEALVAAGEAETAAAAAAAAAPPSIPSGPVSPVVQYLVDAELLRKGIRVPPVPKTPEQQAAAAAAKEERKKAKEERKAAGAAGRGRGRGRGGRGRVVVGDGSNAEKEKEEDDNAGERDPAYIAARDAAVAQACELIRKHRFGFEHVGDTALLRSPTLWGTLLDMGMPMTALVRNLGRLTSLGLLRNGGTDEDVPNFTDKVVGQLTNARAVQGARLHPIVLLEAMRQYEKGRGDKGSLTWSPAAAVSAALEAAFYLAFKNVVPTGKRYLLGLDVSGSMGGNQCLGMRTLTARDATAAIAMALLRTEADVRTMAFCDSFVPLELSKEMSLAQVQGKISGLPFGSTDCAQPMIYAAAEKIPVDVFVVMTDNETWAGREKPADALRRYRKEMGLPNARLMVMAFSATGFTIADPTDSGMLDVGGLDSGVPQILADFACGKL